MKAALRIKFGRLTVWLKPTKPRLSWYIKGGTIK